MPPKKSRVKGRGSPRSPRSDYTDEVFSSSSDLLSLPDNLLCGILLSGYLSTDVVLKIVRFVSRQCNALVLKYLSVLDFGGSNRRGIYINMDHKKHMAVFLSKISMLQYVDLSNAKLVKSVKFPKLSSIIPAGNFQNIRYLSLRGTTITGDSLADIASFSSLMYLDISKSSASLKAVIGDDTVLKLANLSNLHWLNLSGTAVSDVGIEALSNGGCARSLRYLGLQQCTGLSKASCKHISRFSLVLLDMSGVSDLTDDSIAELVGPG
jgi:hypothetical protein